MDLLKTKIYENILYIISTIVLGITSFFLLKKVIILIFFLVVCLFFVFRIIYYYKIIKNKNYYCINTICTGIKVNFENFGDAKNYEFEPINKNEYDEVIYLKIYNDDAGGIFNKKHKIALNHGYTLYFKYNNKAIIADQEHYLGYTRYVLPE